jgi:hypothetical protein
MNCLWMWSELPPIVKLWNVRRSYLHAAHDTIQERVIACKVIIQMLLENSGD